MTQIVSFKGNVSHHNQNLGGFSQPMWFPMAIGFYALDLAYSEPKKVRWRRDYG